MMENLLLPIEVHAFLFFLCLCMVIWASIQNEASVLIPCGIGAAAEFALLFIYVVSKL
jgi:hypothetical protein